MAQFRAEISTQRGAVSRLGHKKSGISILLNGWNDGVMVESRFNYASDLDIMGCSIRLTK